MKILLVSVMVISFIGCATNGERDERANTKKGAGIGAAVGALAGALLSKDKKQGAILGGVLGGLAGGTYGSRLDKQANELAEIAETRRTDHGIVTKLKGDITFKTGAANVKNTAEERIAQMANVLKKYPENKITIIGHTDATGSKSVNKMLSEKRAMSVKNLLVQDGVPSKSIKTVGAADTDPIASNKTVDGRQANRRVELAITMEDPKK